MKDKVKFTNELLKQISNHVTARPKYRYKSFVLSIQDDTLNLIPEVKAFPDVHHRYPADKDDLITHILLYHMSYIFEDKDTSIRYSDYFSKGEYKFAIPYGSRNRVWVKIK